MMEEIEIVFCNPHNREETFSLKWKLINNEAAYLWFKLFCKNLKIERPNFARFAGFLDGDKNLECLLNSINDCISIINNDGRYFIKEEAINYSQELSNALHHHFEVLIGGRDNPTEYFKASSNQVRTAVTMLNYHIHDLETYMNNLNNKNKGLEDFIFCAIFTEVRGSDRFRMPQDFDKYFNINIDFGDIVSHYCQIGKTWIDVFRDQDQDIFPEAVIPHYAISGEFDIMMGEYYPDQKFLNEMQKFIKEKGLDPKDPSLKLGHLPLAKLIRLKDFNNKDYIKKLGQFCDIKSIKAYSNGSCLAEKEFSKSILTCDFF